LAAVLCADNSSETYLNAAAAQHVTEGGKLEELAVFSPTVQMFSLFSFYLLAITYAHPTNDHTFSSDDMLPSDLMFLEGSEEYLPSHLYYGDDFDHTLVSLEDEEDDMEIENTIEGDAVGSIENLMLPFDERPLNIPRHDSRSVSPPLESKVRKAGMMDAQAEAKQTMVDIVDGKKKKAPPPSEYHVVGRSPSPSSIDHQSLPTNLPDALPPPPATHAQEVSLLDTTTQDPLHPNEVFNQIHSVPLSDSKPKAYNSFVQNLWTAINVSK
jgi:hypothetical protein